MPDKKLPDSEIVKALECAIRNNCDCNCVFLLPNKVQDVLDLINRQNAKIDYKEAEIILLRDEGAKANLEVERLLQKLQQAQETIDSFTDIGKVYSEIKAEAYKECIEKVRKLAVGMHPCSDEMRIFDSDLDNILKELVGEDNTTPDNKN